MTNMNRSMLSSRTAGRCTRLAGRVGALARRTLASRRGTVSMLAGLFAIPMIGAAGIAIDFGRAYFVKARLTSALDSAALAGGRVMTLRDPTADILMYFNTNFTQGVFNSATATPTIAMSADKSTVTTSATATMPTTFMKVLGMNNMTMTSRNVVRRTSRGQELILVMDNTGSMAEHADGTTQSNGPGSKIDAMRVAATDLVNLLYGNNETITNMWVGIVPFVASVNVGPSHTSWVSDLASKNYSPSTWRGCVEARTGAVGEEDDAPPSSGKWKAYYYPQANYTYAGFITQFDNNWTAGQPVQENNYPLQYYPYNHKGANIFCSSSVIVPLQASKTAAVNAISAMAPQGLGGTMGNLGMAWGWRAISPRWRGLWGGTSPSTLPLDYNTSYMDKVVVFLTDGENQFASYGSSAPFSSYTAYGRLTDNKLGTTNATTATTIINNKFSALCTAMKAQGIIIYTIGLMVDVPASNTMLQNCATDTNHYFNSPTPTQLAAVFQNIAAQLSNLRLQQ